MNIPKESTNAFTSTSILSPQSPRRCSEEQHSSRGAPNVTKINHTPYITLNQTGLNAALNKNGNKRVPLFLTDIQDLLMLTMLAEKPPFKPSRWCIATHCEKIKQTVVLVLNGISLFDFNAHPLLAENCKNILDTSLEVIMPPLGNDLILEELIQLPYTCIKVNHVIVQHETLEHRDPVDGQSGTNRNINICGSNEPVVYIDEHGSKLPPGDKYPRTKLLLSALQMIDEGYPMPLKGGLQNNFSSFVFTKDHYTPVTNNSPLFGVDCEMCRTMAGQNELTRISIVNEQLETIYESLVRPEHKITDYLTQFSGITAETMKTVTKTLSEVHSEIRELLPSDAILVGQSLNCDLNAMRMMHPYVIDTSICFNSTGLRKRKTKLKNLALEHLNEKIQRHDGGHDSVEDSIATIKLIKKKLANSVEYGDKVLENKNSMGKLSEFMSQYFKDNSVTHKITYKKRTTIVSSTPLANNIRSKLNEIKGIEEALIFEKISSLKKKSPLDQKQEEDLRREYQEKSLLRDYEMQNNMQAMSKAVEVCKNNSLLLTNLYFGRKPLLAANVGNTFKNIDNYIKSIWNEMSKRSLLVVVLGGNKDCTNGMVMYGLKK